MFEIFKTSEFELVSDSSYKSDSDIRISNLMRVKPASEKLFYQLWSDKPRHCAVPGIEFRP